MKPTDDRINFLAHHIVDRLIADGAIKVRDKAEASQEVKKGMIKYFQREEAADQKVRAKISSIKRGVPEGSQEWEILYNKYFEEELGNL